MTFEEAMAFVNACASESHEAATVCNAAFANSTGWVEKQPATLGERAFALSVLNKYLLLEKTNARIN